MSNKFIISNTFIEMSNNLVISYDEWKYYIRVNKILTSPFYFNEVTYCTVKN